MSTAFATFSTALIAAGGVANSVNWALQVSCVQNNSVTSARAYLGKAAAQAAVFSDAIPWSISFAVDLERVGSLSAGWDGPGSVPVSDQAIAIADTLVSASLRGSKETATAPSLIPAGDGSVQIEWHEKHGELELLIEPDGALSIGGRDYRNGIEFEGSDTAALSLFYRWAPWMAAEANDADDVSVSPQFANFRVAA